MCAEHCLRRLGAVTPSAFYLVLQMTLLFRVHIARPQRSVQNERIAVGLCLMTAVAMVPFIKTIVGIVLLMSAPLALRFLRSASAHTQLDESITEIAIVGRSNVGKSSLINALAHRNKLAKTSKTPGATQLLNIYEFGDPDSGRWLVDLPGYGFAKLSTNRVRQMSAMINDYMAERESLSHAVVLIDALVGPTELDLQTIDWLRHIELDFVIVGTKVDKIKSAQRSKKQKKAAEQLQMASGDIRWVSAEKGTGIPELRSQLAYLLST